MNPTTPGYIIHDLDIATRENPELVALEYQTTQITFRQLHDMAKYVVTRLQSEGISRHDVVLLDANKSPMTVACLYGVLAVGGVACPVAPGTPSRRKSYMAENSGAKLYLRGWKDEDIVGPAQTEIPELSLSWSDGQSASTSDDSLMSVCPELLQTDPALLIYTSGTTALPKGICGLHQNIAFAVHSIGLRLQYKQSDRVLCFLPFSFDYGLYQILLGIHSRSVCLLVEERDSKIGITKLLRQTDATVLPAVAPIIEQFALLVAKIDDLPSLRLITNTGAPIRPRTLSRIRESLPAVKFQAMYGLTECKRATIADPDADIAKPGTCGTALPGTEVVVRDEEGKIAPPGTMGEIVVRGPHVMAGYWGEEKLTQEKFRVRNAVFRELHTGDLGYLDEDGHLFCCGRMDDQFKQNGFRTSCSEIEAAALAIEGVDAAAVLPPDIASKRLAVIFICGMVGEKALLDTLSNHVDNYKVPGTCKVIEKMPLTENGKIDKRSLEALI